MTQPKTLTPAQALRALSEGKKLARKDWAGWIYLIGDRIVDEKCNSYKMTYADEFYEYTEPAPKVVWVEYLRTPHDPTIVSGGELTYFKGIVPTTNLVWTYTPTGRKIEV